MIVGAAALALTLALGSSAGITVDTMNAHHRILFSSGSPPALFVVDSTGKHVVPIARGRLAQLDAAWSPNGQRIAFTGYSPKYGRARAEIYVLSLRSRRIVQLTRNDVEDATPVWSPNGAAIAFLERHVSAESEVASDVMTISLTTGSEKRLTTDSMPKTQLRWSPSGRMLSFIGLHGSSKSLYLLDSSTGKSVAAADNVNEAAWSPDGRRLAAVQARADGVHLILVKTDGTVDRSLIRIRRGSIIQPRWSPARPEIVFGHAIGSRTNLEKVKVASGALQAVTRPGPFADSSPAWSPNGSQIVFVRAELRSQSPRNAALAVVDGDGRHLRILRGANVPWGGDPILPVWQPTG
jgi:Tol biopolymer transport system component